MSDNPTIAEVKALIAIPKIAAQKMKWQVKIGNYNPKRYIFYTALIIENEIREGLYFRANYKGSFQQLKEGTFFRREEVVTCDLSISKHRIFAYDYDSYQYHKNNIGKGLPYYQKKIIGLHQHIWTENGYGYAEPLYLTNHTPQTIIEAFLAASNITIIGGFAPIPSEQESFL